MRLTSDPFGHGSPAWSPDGLQIAFLRYRSKDASGFYVMPATGGSERKIVSSLALENIYDRMLDWSPDGRWLAVSDKSSAQEAFRIWLVSVERGTRTPLSTPPRESLGDTGPTFSPDGATVAFKRTVGTAVNDLYEVSVRGGAARRLTSDNRFIPSHAWSADGRDVVFNSNRSGESKFWRVSKTSGLPIEITSIRATANFLTIAKRGDRMAFSHWFADTNIWKYPIGPGNGGTNGAVKVIASTWDDTSAQISPDGQQIAFRTNRSGNHEIWISGHTGSQPAKLTNFKGPLAGSPRWSPDGRHIVFDARPEGNADIYVVEAGGGTPRRLTTALAADAVPSWSSNGKWIYFASNRTGDWQIWKINAESDETRAQAIQVTHRGGFAAFDRPGDPAIYYAKGSDVGRTVESHSLRRRSSDSASTQCWLLGVLGRRSGWYLFSGGVRNEHRHAGPQNKRDSHGRKACVEATF